MGKPMEIGTDGFAQEMGSPLTTEYGGTELATFPLAPHGRLTTEATNPVSKSDRAAQSTVYFLPYKGTVLFLPDASNFWRPTFYTSLSVALSGLTTGALYDLFIYEQNPTPGNPAMILGPAWTVGGGSATARGTGAGSTELQRVNGQWCNAQTLSGGGGVAIGRGVYVGTLRATSATTTEDSVTKRFLWNNFNRVKRLMLWAESNSHAYTGVQREWRGGTATRLEYVLGIAEDDIDAKFGGQYSPSGTTATSVLGIGVDSVTVAAELVATFGTTMLNRAGMPHHLPAALGYHYLSLIEGSTTASTTFASGAISALIWN